MNLRRIANRWSIAAALLLAACLVAGCPADPDGDFPTEEELNLISGLRKVRTNPRVPSNKYADDAAAAALGAEWFAERAFSPCNLTCRDCHPPPDFVFAGPERGRGCTGDTKRNIKSLSNVAFVNWFYWDGRKDSLWSHASFPLLNEIEMNSTPALVRQVMVNQYSDAYAAVFGKRPEDESDDNRLLANFGKAIEAYLRRDTLRVDAPFDDRLDRFVAAARAGNPKSSDFYDGMLAFVRKGRCILCHRGPMLSDGDFHNIGVSEPISEDTGHRFGLELLRADPLTQISIYSDDRNSGSGRLAKALALTDDETVGFFRTPSLRNIELSPPYLHTGMLKTLEEVVDFYDRGGDPSGFVGKRADTIIPLHLTEKDKAALVDLMKSLTAPPR
jgi:cytochrome c peroxidase